LSEETMNAAIRNEVVLFLKDSLANRTNEVSYRAVNYTNSPTWGLVVAELDKIIDQYIEGGKPVLGVGPDAPEPQEIEVGGLVRLTGFDWDGEGVPHVGDIYAISYMDGDSDPVFFDRRGKSWYVTKDAEYGAEVYKKASEL